MLKGTTKIELTDVVSGKKQVIEKHNMVTNAVYNLFQPTFGHLTSESLIRDILPAHSTLFGGLLLFDKSITEDVNTLYAPKDVSCVGCARFGTTSPTGLYMGQYNATESEVDLSNKRVKYVYDFGTAQANGTIASVCLTGNDAGYGGYGVDERVHGQNSNIKTLCSNVPVNTYAKYGRQNTLSTGNNEYIFAIDIDNDFGYYLTLTNKTSVKIAKKRLGFRNYSMFVSGPEIVQTVTLALPSEIPNNYSSYNYDPDTNSLYIVSSTASNANITAGAKFMITKISKDSGNDWTVTQKEYTNTTTDPLTMSNNFGARTAFVHKDYVYLQYYHGTNPTKLYKFNLDTGNSSFVGTATVKDVMAAMHAIDGRVYWQSYYSGSNSTATMGYCSVSNETAPEGEGIKPLGNAGFKSYSSTDNTAKIPGTVPVIGYPMFFFMNSVTTEISTTFWYMSNYLATINNLGTPITKVNTQTMKITYTIQES